MNFLQRFEGKISHLDKYGPINNLLSCRLPIETSNSYKLNTEPEIIYSKTKNNG